MELNMGEKFGGSIRNRMVALNLLRGHLRKAMQTAAQASPAQGIHTGTLVKSDGALKLHITHTKIDAGNYEVQTLKNCIVWLTTQERMHSNVAPQEAGGWRIFFL